MPRRPRILIDEGYYHLLTRGNDKKIIFRNPQDYSYFLGIIGNYLPQFRIGLVHYCLMDNHIHLIVRAYKAEDLPKFMQRILQVYAHYFRRNYDAVGFLFQNRYKSYLLENIRYLLECGRYIERNPLRAGVVRTLEEYVWSSYAYYARGQKNTLITAADPLYTELGPSVQERQKQYRDFLLQPQLHEYMLDRQFRI